MWQGQGWVEGSFCRLSYSACECGQQNDKQHGKGVPEKIAGPRSKPHLLLPLPPRCGLASAAARPHDAQEPRPPALLPQYTAPLPPLPALWLSTPRQCRSATASCRGKAAGGRARQQRLARPLWRLPSTSPTPPWVRPMLCWMAAPARHLLSGLAVSLERGGGCRAERNLRGPGAALEAWRSMRAPQRSPCLSLRARTDGCLALGGRAEEKKGSQFSLLPLIVPWQHRLCFLTVLIMQKPTNSSLAAEAPEQSPSKRRRLQLPTKPAQTPAAAPPTDRFFSGVKVRYTSLMAGPQRHRPSPCRSSRLHQRCRRCLERVLRFQRLWAAS